VTEHSGTETPAAEAGTGVTEHSGTETPAAEAADPAPDEFEGTDTPGDAIDAEDGTTVADSVDTISGIGPAYAERLGNAGVETVPELREADAVSLAEATDISEKRISRWQERAAE
jgi:predicted flap endonuclease-1-like 5' DNA nuclease